MDFQSRDCIAITEFTKEEMLTILKKAEEIENGYDNDLLKGIVIATLFYEPSTRTRLSFESAASKLGARVIGFSDTSSTSVKKGETLKDTIVMASSYADLIVLRHPNEGSARYAAQVSPVPLINAGDGANQHPTQTLLDLYSIQKTQNTLDNLTIAFVGDLKYGRTVHSLVLALTNFKVNFLFISPKELEMPRDIKELLTSKNIPFEEKADFRDDLKKIDILYMTRIQKERFQDPLEYERLKSTYVFKKSHLRETKDNFRILHPLPRVSEIDPEIDDDPKAYYFKQAANGVPVRQALLSLILGK